MSYDRRMVTKEQIADMLKGLSATELARRSGVTERTIYRLRSPGGPSPTLDTVQRVIDAATSMRAEARRLMPRGG